MMGEVIPSANRAWAVAAFVLGVVAFGLAYAQAPLYYSNQNQYFLHGLADAGHGFLAADWLANTASPTPVFTLLVAATVGFLHPWAFHVYYALLQGVYFAGLLGIFGYLSKGRDTIRLRLCFLALLVAVHAALVRWASYRVFGHDYPWYFQAGVAGQYVLGPMFQPSTFGVLLILAIYLALRHRPFAAVCTACLAASVHSTYLPGAALLTLGIMYVVWRDGQGRTALLLGGWALALVLPVTVFLLATFGPTSPEAFAEAQRILVHVRIPHHCLPQLWCDSIAAGQIAWFLLALALVWGTRLFALLFIVFLGSLALTILQVATASDSLALLFPWRTSAVLVPVATAVILGRLVLAAAHLLDTRATALASGGVLTMLAVSGLALMASRQGFQSSPEEVPLLEFVRAHKTEGDLYLIPVQVPDLKASTRGSLSSDFKPAAAKKGDSRLIPVDLQRFRLPTGAPIFVDFKSVPYADTDVLEWRRRLDWNRRVQDCLRENRLSDVWDELREHRITHLVTTADRNPQDPRLRQVFADDSYRVYQLLSDLP